jgi:predicted dienelactone hydrolase
MSFPGLLRFALLTLLCCCCCLAQPGVGDYASVPPIDAPELAHRGPHSVGVRTLEVVNPGQVNILEFNKETGEAPLYDRPLTLEVWYPAVIPDGQREHTVYKSAMPGQTDKRPEGVPDTFEIDGKALREAPPAKGAEFPLVIVSHGYPGTRTFLSYLSENLASKGYVVAAIDHTDSVFDAVGPFQSTLLNRSKDQWFTINKLGELAGDTDHFLHGILDSSRAAIIGYSMGGYGALTSAGAGYSATSTSAKMLPGGYFAELTAGNAEYEQRDRSKLKAIVALAPWGAQPPHNSWDDAGLAGIRVPSFFIAGDQDDISEFETGIKRAFEGAVNSDRRLLVFQNARHNIGGNPPPTEALVNFSTRESFDEPVWRKDRITAINQHFVTAFLDLYLKGDESRRDYLNVPTVRSNDGVWPVKRGERTGGKYSQGAVEEGHSYWKGFQRRWALGLELHHYEAGQKTE